MATQKQIAANRLNAQHSTGPRTEQGKRVARMNALKHGIDIVEEISCGEQPVELQELTAEFDREFQPVGIAERTLVDLLIRKSWLMRRHAFLGADLTNYGVTCAFKTKYGNEYGAGFVANIDAHNRLHRHMVDTERSFFRYLEELERRQADRLQHPAQVSAPVTDTPVTENPEIGFVSQEAPVDPVIDAPNLPLAQPDAQLGDPAPPAFTPNEAPYEPEAGRV